MVKIFLIYSFKSLQFNLFYLFTFKFTFKIINFQNSFENSLRFLGGQLF